MRAYKVEFDGMENIFHDSATEEQIINWNFANSITLRNLQNDSSITLNTLGFWGGYDKYKCVTFTAYECQSYRCNCCNEEQPGDGMYDICYVCEWQNDSGQKESPEEIDAVNGISLSQAMLNIKDKEDPL